jgi:cyclopropane fatty-acyl-phospholipid synthase-like methyltransferase
MVARCRAKGHRVEEMDAVAFLKRQTDRSVGAIFSAQVVEHLTPDVFRAFLETSRAKLAAGGQLIFETINPHAIEAFKTFYTDLTRQRPIFPEVAVTLCRLAGFRRAHVFYPNGSGDPEQDRRLQGEYAVVATSSDPDKLRAR